MFVASFVGAIEWATVCSGDSRRNGDPALSTFLTIPSAIFARGDNRLSRSGVPSRAAGVGGLYEFDALGILGAEGEGDLLLREVWTSSSSVS